ncbi:MAG: WG repeat-containing protein [Bacteroidales bacterium]|nr:WG repeat-containing protein [Bacteroidales bacterium]
MSRYLLIATAILITMSFSSCNLLGGDKIAELKLIPVKSGKEFQYIDKEGKIVINPQFSEATIFRNGLALVQSSGNEPKWGFITDDGKYSISASYKRATVFSEDMAWVVSDNSAPTAINTKGEVKITLADAQTVRIFKEGLAAYSVMDSIGVKWGFVDKAGNVKINPQFSSTGNFSNGKCAVRNKDGKWGYIDKEGKIIINNQFDGAREFVKGKAIVISGGKSGVIDENGKYLINPQFSEMLNDNDMFLFEQDGKWGWCDSEGKISINAQFKDAYPFNNNDLAAVRSGDNFGYIDKTGKIVINPQFDHAIPFNGKLALVSSSNKIGFIDKEGKYVINPQFDGISQDLMVYMLNGSSNYESVETDFFNVSAIVSRMNLTSPEGLLLSDQMSQILTKLKKSENELNLYSGEHMMFDSQKITNDATIGFSILGVVSKDVSDGWYSKKVFDASAKVNGFAYDIHLMGNGFGREKNVIEAIEKSLTGYKKDETNSTEDVKIYKNEKQVIFIKNNYGTVVVLIVNPVYFNSLNYGAVSSVDTTAAYDYGD